MTLFLNIISNYINILQLNQFGLYIFKKFLINIMPIYTHKSSNIPNELYNSEYTPLNNTVVSVRPKLIDIIGKYMNEYDRMKLQDIDKINITNEIPALSFNANGEQEYNIGSFKIKSEFEKEIMSKLYDTLPPQVYNEIVNSIYKIALYIKYKYEEDSKREITHADYVLDNARIYEYITTLISNNLTEEFKFEKITDIAHLLNFIKDKIAGYPERSYSPYCVKNKRYSPIMNAIISGCIFIIYNAYMRQHNLDNKIISVPLMYKTSMLLNK